MINSASIPEKIRMLFQQQKLAVLATVNDQQPETFLVAFCADDSLKRLIIATDRNTLKFQQLQSNPNASLLIHSSKNQESDFQQAMVVSARGIAAELHGELAGEYRELLLEKHPALKDFLSSPEVAIVRIEIDNYRFVEHFQEVFEYQP